jgi:hypothetical protein
MSEETVHEYNFKHNTKCVQCWKDGTSKIKERNIISRNRPFVIIATHHRGSCPMLM